MRPMKPNESCDQKAAIRRAPEPAFAPSVKAGAGFKTPCRTPVPDIGDGLSLGRQARDAGVKKNKGGFSQISIILAMCDVRGLGRCEHHGDVMISGWPRLQGSLRLPS